jgi:hypothetical protein
MGSHFGVWVGPRGGYNYYGTIASLIEAGIDTDGNGVVDAQYGSKSGGSIDVADSRYIKKFAEMTVDWTNRFKVNYWKCGGVKRQIASFRPHSLERARHIAMKVTFGA